MLQALLAILSFVLFIRFHTYDVAFRLNPVANKIFQITQPLVNPIKKALPPSRYDWASLMVIWLLSFIFTALMFQSVLVGVVMGSFLAIINFFNLTFYAIVITVVASWLQTPSHQPVLQIAFKCCRWIMRPISQYVPTFRGLDFSPVVALLGLSILEKLTEALFSSLIH